MSLNLTPAVVTSATTQLSELEKIQQWVGSERYACDKLSSWVSYPQEGPWAGRCLVDIPTEDVHTDRAGYARIYLARPEIDSLGRPTVKVGLSYIKQSGVCQLLQPNYQQEQSGWCNIESAAILVEQLRDGGCFDPACFERVLEWAANYIGQNKQKALCLNGFKAILKANKMGAKSTRNIKSKFKAGEDTGLGFALIDFAGATLIAQASPLMSSKQPSAVYRSTLNDLLKVPVAFAASEV